MGPAVLLPLLAPVLDRLVSLIPDPNEAAKARQEAEAQLIGAFTQSDNQQVEINKAEAASSMLFVAGWRPFIGWVCGAAIAYQFILTPIIAYLLVLFAPGTPFPQIDTSWLMELTVAMLGLGGLRTIEKLKGVTKGPH